MSSTHPESSGDTTAPSASAARKPSIGIVGLGEVGRIYGAALSAAGHQVSGYDPHVHGPVDGVRVTDTLADAVDDADVVLVLTAARASRSVAEDAVDHLRQDTAYVDCTSSAPGAKRALLEVFAHRPDVRLADVAILGPVIQLQTATPLMAAGPAAEQVAELMAGIGSDVDVVDGALGDAMAHKLLRSVFMKSFAAATVEAVTAGRAVGFEEWIRDQIARELAGDGQRTIDRWLTGSVVHAARRSDEMEAAGAYLDDLGVDSTMSKAAASHLRTLQETGAATHAQD
jgi:3-hydroxyisobutyrate dehydrogenase-like beta-hydroxyacid dehydrogenase